MKRYEVLWYVGATEQEAMLGGNIYTKEFSTKKQALNYYEKHKNDAGCFGWLVTKRNSDWEIVEDIIY